MKSPSTATGFTLIELMIVVAIIGLLAAIAVPNFVRFQSKARRAEAYANLAEIARSEKSFQAEYDSYFQVALPMPDWDLYGGLGSTKMPWDAASQAAFDELGWFPTGQVHYSYGVNTGTSAACHAACGAAATPQCFTANAIGDVDDDSLAAEVIYAAPARDASGAVVGDCPSTLSTGVPYDPNTLQPVYNEVAIHYGTDDF